MGRLYPLKNGGATSHVQLCVLKNQKNESKGNSDASMPGLIRRDFTVLWISLRMRNDGSEMTVYFVPIDEESC